MTKKKLGRPATDQAMVHVTIRIPQHIVDRYKRYENYTGLMRDVLTKYVDRLD